MRSGAGGSPAPLRMPRFRFLGPGLVLLALTGEGLALTGEGEVDEEQVECDDNGDRKSVV